jgi:hypothetical protein
MSRYAILAKIIYPKRKARLPEVLLFLQKEGMKLQEMEQAIFAPRIVPTLRKKSKMKTQLGIRKDFIVPFLKALRGSRTLLAAKEALEITTLSTYHHWEMGRRDIPFEMFLKAIDVFSGRLPAFLETLGLKNKLKAQGLEDLHIGRYELFFNDPWTPTILMSLRLPQVLKLSNPQEQAVFLSHSLKIPLSSVEKSLDLLVQLQLIYQKEGKFFSNPVQFNVIPSITPEKINEIHQYWFDQAANFLNYPGYHKLEQHALTHESKDKIVQWISELREKIRQEVKSSGEPETLIHIHWQLAELIT